MTEHPPSTLDQTGRDDVTANDSLPDETTTDPDGATDSSTTDDSTTDDSPADDGTAADGTVDPVAGGPAQESALATPADSFPAGGDAATADAAAPTTSEPVAAGDASPDPQPDPQPEPAGAAQPGPEGAARPAPRPGPPSARPTPALVPRRPAVAAAPPSTTSAQPAASAEAMAFGRADDDGTVYVRTPDGERSVGSYPGADPAEALAHFARRYDDLLAQVQLLEQRLQAPDVPVSEVDSGLAKLRAAVKEPDVVGDLEALRARVEALAPIASARKAKVDAERNAAREVARARRTALIEEAEAIAATPVEQVQWRASGQRMKELFEQWQAEQKSQVRLDRRSQDELWKRFSHARSGFDRKRRQHFAQLDETQGAAKAAKEQLVAQAEALQSSTDWAPTATAYKRLMDRWREAGRASRKDDDALWARFRAAQDAFFDARSAVTAEQDKEFEANLAVKLELLTEAEALLPVRDAAATKRALASVQDRWEAAGKVPRADLERVERRLRAVEQAVRNAEDATWRSTNPEGQARARSAVEQLESGIADLQARRDKARAAGDDRRAAEADAAIETRTQWLEQARVALREFGG